MCINLLIHDYTLTLLLITKDNCMLKSPLANRTKVSTCMRRAKVRPMSFKSVVVLERKDAGVTLAHQIRSQELNAVV